MAQSLNALAVGALVKDTGTLYNGKPIIWKIADKGHTGYPSGAVTLITERIISLKCFDAIESGNSDGNRRSYGNNRWTLSNVRQWLNSQAAAGKWYSAQHGADAPPTNANVWSNYNEYDAEAGFLAGFSVNFIAALLTTTHTVGKATVDGGGTESCADKIFLATCTEVGLSGDVTAGSKLALFSNDSSRLAYPTAEAVSKSEYTNSSLNASSPWWWWLADAYASYSYGVRDVNSSGAMDWDGAYSGSYGVRPLCYLKSEILVSVPGEDNEEKNVEVAEEDRAQLVLIASDRILNALNEYPVEVWGEALGAAVASLFTSKQDAAQVAQEDKDKAAEV